MTLESQEALFEFRQGGEVVGGENFSLNDREVDLHLVEPAGVDGSVDQDQVRPLGAEAFGPLSGPDGRNSCP